MIVEGGVSVVGFGGSVVVDAEAPPAVEGCAVVGLGFVWFRVCALGFGWVRVCGFVEEKG